MSAAGSPPTALVGTRHAGTQETQAALLARLDQLLPARPDLSLLARPVRVIVPSRSMRQHVVAAIARHRGTATVGLTVQTLAGFTAQLLARHGHQPRHADPVLEVLARRRAAEHPALTETLDGVEDGLGAVARPVADLLDAGFDGSRDAVPLAGLLRGQAEGVASAPQLLRAIAVVHVAASVQQDLHDLGIGRHADGLRLATELVVADPVGAVAARHVLLHGFVMPSGAELNLLQALVGHASAQAFSCQPPTAAQLARDGTTSSGRCELHLVRAPAPRTEAWQAVRTAQTLAASGVAPEEIAIVARDLTEWGPRLRAPLRRLGLPWSGVAAQAPPGPALWRLGALLELLDRGGETSAERWLDAAWRLPGLGSTSIADVRTAVRALGLARLSQVAGLDVGAVLGDRTSLALPVRTGLAARSPASDDPAGDGAHDDPDGETSPADASARLAQRRIPATVLVQVARAAADLTTALAHVGPHDMSVWATRITDLAAQALGWASPEPAWRALVSALEGLVQRTSRSLTLSPQEVWLLLGPALEGAAAGPIGGRGGGISVLSATEARGRCFQHLLVLGLVRGAWPHSSRPEPLLPQPLRARLRGLLPDLALHAEQQQHERQLLAHLMTAAPQVYLSWSTADDDGRTLAPSPLVDQLLLALGPAQIQDAPDPDMVPLGPNPWPAGDHARRHALHGADDLAATETVAVALDATRPSWLAPGHPALAQDVAAARAAARRELDAGPLRRGLGPFDGLIGRLRTLGDPTQGDPRNSPLFVTTVERTATCAWQAFLTRFMRVEPTPDPGGSLPGIDARLVGMVVHGVLEAIAQAALGDTQDDLPLDQRQPVPVPWPLPEELARLVTEAAQRIALEEGVALPGLWRVLAERSRPFLEIAQLLDWAQTPPNVLAVERTGTVQIQARDGARLLCFRADRIDQDVDGALVLTDYKTGAPRHKLKSEDKRTRKVLADAAVGTHLQVAVYATSAPAATGRYLHLRPDVPGLAPSDLRRQAALPGNDDETDRLAVQATADRAAAIAIDAIHAGALLPRLVDGKGRTPAACTWCDVRAACHQGDSTARLRQAAWAEQAHLADDLPGVERDALALWRLPFGDAP